MITILDLRPGRPWFIVVWLVLFAVIVFGCNEDGSNSSSAPGRSGTLHLALEWRTDTGPGVAIQASPSGDVCEDYLITSINVRVLDSSAQTAATAENVPCSERGVVLGGLAPGSGYSVEVEGMVGGIVQWRGEAGSISVVAGQTSETVHVEMIYDGDPVAAPTASITPADGATNVAIDTVVTIQFSEDVVPASVNTDTIMLSRDTTAVSGTVIYDSDTYQASFTPDIPLAVNATYSVTVDETVTDRYGQTMEQDVVSQFATTTVWYVDGGYSASGTGRSWAEAFQTISEAISTADNSEQIWVKSGRYPISGQIVVNKSVLIYGGFEGVEDQLDNRDPATWETIVDGEDSGYRCFYISSSATIDGFTITGGAVSFESSPRGGGMYIANCSPNITNCIFSENTVGPSNGYGGAIYIVTGNPRISHCLFQSNTANAGTEAYGGALYNDQGGPIILYCRFIDNTSTGGYGNDAGAVYNNGATSSTVFADCMFEANSSSGEVATGGAVYNRNCDGLVIKRCRFNNNLAFGGYISGYGGAIYNYQSDVVIENCAFYANSVLGRNAGYGGAIFNRGSAPAVNQCTFFGNDVSAYEPTDGTFGGAIANLTESNVEISNSIVWDNHADTGIQVYTDGTSSAVVSYCDIDQYGITGIGNQRIDPRLAEGLHLKADSPCINSGDNSAAPVDDIDGEVRPQGSVVDMGSDEFLDGDGDRLPDYWEAYYGASEAGEDPDSDLVPNLSEYHLGTDPDVAQIVSAATLRGAFRDDGVHTEGDLSSPIGDVSSNAFRAFFIFDVSELTADITGAALRLELVAYNSNTIPETFTIYDVETTAASLAADTSGQTGVDIYTDLGSGTSFGQVAPTPSDSSTILDISLNQNAVDAVNAARVGSGKFKVGLRLESASVGHLLFSTGDEARTHQLVLLAE